MVGSSEHVPAIHLENLMALSFTDELPEGVVKRRTKADEYLAEILANPGKWALLKNHADVPDDKLSARAGDTRAYLKKLVGQSDEYLQYDVRSPGAGLIQGFVRFPTATQTDEDYPDNENL